MNDVLYGRLEQPLALTRHRRIEFQLWPIIAPVVALQTMGTAINKALRRSGRSRTSGAPL
jgi:hypothetical protein